MATPEPAQPIPIQSPAGPNTAALPPTAPGLQAELEEFKRNFFADPRRRRQSAGSRTTWRAAYSPYLRRLLRFGEGSDGLSEALLVQVL